WGRPSWTSEGVLRSGTLARFRTLLPDERSGLEPPAGQAPARRPGTQPVGGRRKMISVTDLRSGTKVEMEGGLWEVIEYQHQKIGRGGAKMVAKFRDRKSTRLNSSHVKISYAVFCLKKKTKNGEV